MHYCPKVGDPCCSTERWGRGSLPGRDENPSFPFGLPFIPQQGLGVPVTSKGSLWPFTQPSLLWVGHGFMWCLAAIKWLFPRSFLLSIHTPFPTPLGREGRLCLEFVFYFSVFVFLSMPVGISRWLASSAPSLGYVKIKKIQGTHNFVSL